MRTRTASIVLLSLCAFAHSSNFIAAIEVIRVVKQGEAVTEEHAKTLSWPTNKRTLVNDRLRADGWQVFSSVDVHHPQGFEFSPRTLEEVQHLIDVFATIKAEQLRIRFAKGNEPRSIDDLLREHRSRSDGPPIHSLATGDSERFRHFRQSPGR